jgi:hypothetical protein
LEGKKKNNVEKNKVGWYQAKNMLGYQALTTAWIPRKTSSWFASISFAKNLRKYHILLNEPLNTVSGCRKREDAAGEACRRRSLPHSHPHHPHTLHHYPHHQSSIPLPIRGLDQGTDLLKIETS